MNRIQFKYLLVSPFREYSTKLSLAFLLILGGMNCWGQSEKTELRCHFTSQKVFVLSGPAMSVLGQLDDLDLTQIKGVVKTSSVPLPPILSTREDLIFIPHTLFLSSKLLKDFEGATVIYDQGQELKKTLKKSMALKLLEVKTRDLDPFSASRAIISLLKPQTENCEKSWEILEELLSESKERSLKLKLPNYLHLFFLGTVDPDKKLPDLMMNNDGPVKFIRQNKLAKLYPSELAYVSVSQKILEDLKKREKILFIGLSSEERMTFVPDIKEDVEGNIYINIYRPEFLIPGPMQVMMLAELENLLQLPVKLNIKSNESTK